MRFVDSNIFLRYLTNDNKRQQKLAADIFDSMLHGRDDGFTTDVHIHETAYILASPGGYNLPHEEIGNILRPLLLMPNLKIQNKRLCLEALDVFSQNEFLDYADALAVTYMRKNGIQDIYSFDKDFNRVEGVNRLEVVPQKDEPV